MNIEGGIHSQRLQTYFVFTITEKNLCSLRTHLLILVLYQSCTKSTWKFITMHLCLLLINPN